MAAKRRKTAKAKRGAARAVGSGGVRVVRTAGATASTPVVMGADAGAARRGAARAGAAAANGGRAGHDVLLDALASQELTPTHELTISPTRPSARGRRTAAARRAASVDLAVDVAENESAVILVEQDGEYSWHFPIEPAARPAAARRGAAARRARPRTSVTIRVKLTPAPPAATAEGEARRGISFGGVFGKAKAIVLKFVARAAVGVAMKFLERNVRKGLIVMDGDDPAAWRRISNIADLGLPPKPQLRILLWVHGTFSSTAGSFGALAGTPDGRLLLEQARARYDAVIGFDHATLAETPFENAVDLVERLGRFRTPMQIDAVTYSRGGLVFRSLLEQILPTSESHPEVGQVVFVAVPNNGTLLAEPENWKALVDLYTNLSMGAFALLQLLPAAAPTALILSELISGLGAFVKYLAEVIVTDAVVPGLSAQEANGEFVRALNETGPNQPVPEGCRYLAVTSNFDPRAAAAPGSAATGLAQSFLGKLANGLVDRLMNEPNDLVVNTGSMKTIDPAAGDFIDAALDFGDSPVVYHTVYFAQAGVAQQLRGWLMDDAARTGLLERRGLLTVRPSPRSPFTRVRFHDNEGRRPAESEPVAAAAVSAEGRRGARRGRAAAAAPPPTRAPEETQAMTSAANAAATEHLTKLFGVRSAPEPMRASAAAPPTGRRGVAAAHATPSDTPRPRAYAPALTPEDVQTSYAAGRDIRLVSFQQTHRSIPVFGTRATVELDASNRMVAASAKLARVSSLSPEPTLSPTAALDKLLGAIAPMDADTSANLSRRVRGEQPPLTFFHDRMRDSWHLAYVFSDVPALPKSFGRAGAARRGAAKGAAAKGAAGKRAAGKRAGTAAIRHAHGSASSPRERFPRLDYLVDANDGAVVYYYSVSPMAAKKTVPELPGEGMGKDENQVLQKFFVRALKGGGFELHDPVRKIRTYDFNNQNIDTAAPPGAPIRVAGAQPAFTSPPAISAHVNVTTVFKFYNEVLTRRGVDDAGSYLDNLVNCISPADEPPPQWGNAVWWKNKMWYGQVKAKGGGMRSMAAHLDIIAHELTHGVTEHTSDLVYRDEAGALNESFSDIFGVIVKNRAKSAIYANPDKWDWDVGTGLGENGKPLRNMKNPSVTGDPAHTKEMGNYDPADLAEDFGGVHTFSNIHNKAAYNLLTTRTGKRGSKTPLIFAPDDAAQLFYFTLQRLDRVATFEDVLETMLDVVKTVYREPADQAAKLKAVRAAYADVGIPRATS